MFLRTWVFVLVVILAHPLTWTLATVGGSALILYTVRKLKVKKGK